MMNRYLSVLLFFLLLSTLYSCEKDFDLVAAGGDARMVMNCQINNGSILKAYVTESSVRDNSSALKPITDAVAELYRNDSFVQMMPFVFTDTLGTFGSYQSQEVALPGNKYTVRVVHPKYGTIQGADTLPLVPNVSSHQLLHYGVYNDGYTAGFKFRLQDDGTSEDYYRVNIWQWGRSMYISNSTQDTIFRDYGYASRPEFTAPLSDTARDFGTFLLFSDKNFNGQNKELVMGFNAYDLHFAIEAYVTVELFHVSRAHYLYHKTLEEYRHSNQDVLVPDVFSNIQNGYGILMSQNVYNMTVQVK
jgi:hypothetical protein